MTPAGRSVVLVDDAADIRMLLELLLELAGFEVTATADGPAGLAAIRAARPDVVLLDVQLPGMAGTDVLRLLRADPPTAQLPVVLLTGSPEQDTPTLLGMGATGVLRKPFDPDTVGAQLAALL